MKFNLEIFKKPSEKSAENTMDAYNSKNIDRRSFLKKLSIFGASLLFPGSFGGILNLNSIKNEEGKNNNQEIIEGFSIIKREDWDIDWNKIKIQYEKKFGEIYHIKEKNKIIEKQATTYSYLEEKIEGKELKDYLKRIVIHHVGVSVNRDTIGQVNGIKNFHINKRGWNDVAYHYFIGKDGEILEGRPEDRIGSHAGATLEYKEDFKKYFGDDLKSLNPDREDYSEKLEQYESIIKKDPDYGSLGICLLGNFNEEERVSEKQIESLKNLLNHLKTGYDIPKSNIIYHREVDEKVLKPSGLTLSSPKTNCPGDNFLNKEDMINNLVEDTEASLGKI